MIEETLKKSNLKMYSKEDIDKLSTENMIQYTALFYEAMLDNYADNELFSYFSKVFVYWINRRKDDDYDKRSAYDMYLNFLNTTNHYAESYSICQRLISNNKFEDVVYSALSDLGYVADGLFDMSAYLYYLKKRISICKDSDKKQELLEEFKCFNGK